MEIVVLMGSPASNGLPGIKLPGRVKNAVANHFGFEPATWKTPQKPVVAIACVGRIGNPSYLS